jgi:hypothetical protein
MGRRFEASHVVDGIAANSSGPRIVLGALSTRTHLHDRATEGADSDGSAFAPAQTASDIGGPAPSTLIGADARSHGRGIRYRRVMMTVGRVRDRRFATTPMRR